MVPAEGKAEEGRVARERIRDAFSICNNFGDNSAGTARTGEKGLKEFSQAVTVCVLATSLRVRPEVLRMPVNFDI